MSGLISTFSLESIVIILIVAIPYLLKFVKWIIDAVKEYKTHTKNDIEKGRELERKAMKMQEQEQRLKDLEEKEDKLEQILQNQQRQIEILIKSDMFDIKTWIKNQHAKYMNLGKIDSQSLDLLESRNEIYEAEGGNGWAKRMMGDLRKLPIDDSLEEE